MARLRGTPLQDTPILFGNDADLFALGEWWAGAGEQLDTIGVTLGTGIGSGFIRAGTGPDRWPRRAARGELWNTPFRGATVEDAVSGAALTRLTHRHLGVALDARQLAALDASQSGPVWTAFGQTLGDVLAPGCRRSGRNGWCWRKHQPGLRAVQRFPAVTAAARHPGAAEPAFRERRPAGRGLPARP
ncbi:hypothetical protein BXU09_17360 [Deinococcus sp. LM3]|nr:hypothetical protein BXU09_17360 [Deinococcus sp. LM3]